ncbi:3-hydroxyisobutyryl-CoA hydrolase [Gordonia crocea]|uniref:3-hydroxyisobutyryl-CoA hydrolase n=1 Tax=Gordonia crocea TaxID=589162 RepID=A0A7I9V0B1_9ACTN|nr:3-hydroxyisobutyryl-CoA hydrolase [Gordonia crocea]GED98884.1 3-hydroxyisobutyryl-CoA hydrolase [Gordonia crocea]
MAETAVSAPELVTSVDGRVGRIVLNRPRVINALNHPMVTQMAAVLDEWKRDPEVSAVVITGAGERGLCAGGDIAAIHRDAAAMAGSTDDVAAANTPSAAFWRDEYHLNAAIGDYPKPVVAVMDGIVMGGGVGVSGHASIRVATDRTRLAMPEVGIGLVPDVGGTWLLSHLSDELGTYAALTTTSLDGADAVAVGLATHYVPADALEPFLLALADQTPEEALAAHAVTAPESALAAQREWIAEAFAGDSVSQILARCAAGAQSAVKAGAKIAAMSPMALTVTLGALRAAASDATLRDTLKREYRTSLRCLQYPDLAEGIHAKVIEKGRDPVWAIAELDDIDPSRAAGFTAPLPDGCELTFDETGTHR